MQPGEQVQVCIGRWDSPWGPRHHRGIVRMSCIQLFQWKNLRLAIPDLSGAFPSGMQERGSSPNWALRVQALTPCTGRGEVEVASSWPGDSLAPVTPHTLSQGLSHFLWMSQWERLPWRIKGNDDVRPKAPSLVSSCPSSPNPTQPCSKENEGEPAGYEEV